MRTMHKYGSLPFRAINLIIIIIIIINLNLKDQNIIMFPAVTNITNIPLSVTELK